MSDELRDILEQQLQHMSDPSPMELVGPVAGDLPDGVDVSEAKAVAEEMCDTAPEAHPSGETLYPDELQAREWWVNWVLALPFGDDGEVDTDATPTKQPVAPYDNGHAKPTRWHAGLSEDEHPSTTFETVNNWEGLSVNIDIESHERVLSDELGVGIIIPVGGGDGRQVTLLDWDDVRDPETGDVHPVCAEALERCDGFAEISQSGEGIHQFVFGEIPAGMAKFLRHIDDEPFVGDDLPMIEMYNSGRLTAMTGTHVAGTGDDVVDGQELIDDLCWRFGTAGNNNEGTPTDPFASERDVSYEDTPSHEAVGDELREAVAYDADDPEQWDIPDGEPLDYHAVLRAREREPEMVNTANWELLGYAAALAADNDIPKDQLIEDLRSHDRPGYEFDESKARKETRGVFRKAEAGGYEPPSRGTLVERGILPEKYDDSDPDLDVTQQDRDPAAEAAAVADEPEPETAETDGGTAADDGGAVSTRRSFNDDVRQAIREFNDDVIQAKTARHRIAQALVDHHDYVYPEEEVRDWRSRLYVYNGDEGIYEPRGERHIEDKLEYAAGDFTTNQVTNEIVEKVKRMSAERDRAFTRHPERLVVGNGILNLHTGELSNYTPEEYHTTKLDVNWNPDAGDPEEIDRFLNDIVEDDDVDTLYRLVAHTLYKEYIGEKAAMLIGGGSNGKSMFLSLIEDFIGQWNVVHRELQDFGEDMYALNNLQGKLANLATEIGEQELDDTTAFKKATGRDTIDAPVKYERPITFENYATLMFATNEMPVFGQDNHAIWRRWVYVDFPYTFDADDPEAKDPEPERVIERRIKRDEEFEALLLRCQQEIQRWYEGEPFFADSMDPDEVRDKMKKAAEPIYAFATTCLEATDDDEDYVEKSVVRAAYRAFADEEDLPRIADNEFGKRLLGQRDLSIESAQKKVEGSHIQVYKRVQLTSRGRQVLGIDTTDDEEQNEVDDRYEQARPKVLQRVREMFEDNGRDPVPKSGVVWGVSDVGKSTAEQALDRLIETGDVIEMSDDCVAPK